MVDVIMVLLIFFLLGASLELAPEGALQTQLDPRSGPGGGVSISFVEAVQIGLQSVGDDDVNIYVNAAPLDGGTFADLRAFLSRRIAAGADPSNPLVIAPGTRVRWRYVIAAMDAAVQAGFKNVQFGVSIDEG